MIKLDRFLIKIVNLTLRFPKSVLLLAAIATALSIFFIQKIQIRTSFSDLLPDTHPAVVQARELERVVGGASFIVVAVETKNPEAAGRLLDDLRREIEKEGLDGIRYIDDRPPADFIRRSGLLYLSLTDLDKLSDKIRGRIDRAKLKKAKLYIDFGDGDKGLSDDLDDTKGKYGVFLEANPRYQNREGTLFISLIKPEWRTTDMARTETCVSRLEAMIQRLNPASYDPSLSVRLTGPFVKTLRQKRTTVRDAAVVSALSFLAAITYLLLHFRRKRAFLLIGIPMTVSTLWTLALAYFFYGSLNIFSSVACAVLLGLAADYGIHIYSEYHRHRRLKEAPPEALRASISHLGRAFVTASSTTAAAFFAVALSQFKAFREFGVLAGAGILVCLIAFILLFPPLTLVVEKIHPERIVLREWSDQRQRFSHRWIRWVLSPTNLVLTGLLLLLPFVTVLAGHLRFDFNLNHIMGRQETRELDQKVDGIFNHSVNPEVALARDRFEAGRVARALRSSQVKNGRSKEGTTIKGVLSLADFIPGEQEKKIEKIGRVKALFTPLVLRLMTGNDKEAYEKLRPMLDPVRITMESLPNQVLSKFEDREGGLGRMVFIFPNFEMTQADRFMRFVEEVREVKCPDCEAPFAASGESTVYYEIVRMLFREARTVVGLTLLAVFFALWINFRSVTSALTVITPLFVGLMATLGWMALMGIPFNIINLAAGPIILGTADDYGVHFYQRFVDHPEASLPESYRLVFRPIVGSALTTLIGFGSLLIADMGGIRTFGLVSVVGIGLCTITTLVWFPAFLAFTKRAKL